MEQKQREIEAEANLDRIKQMEQEEVFRKQDETQRREEEAKKRLMQEVYDERQRQIAMKGK